MYLSKQPEQLLSKGALSTSAIINISIHDKICISCVVLAAYQWGLCMTGKYIDHTWTKNTNIWNSLAKHMILIIITHHHNCHISPSSPPQSKQRCFGLAEHIIRTHQAYDHHIILVKTNQAHDQNVEESKLKSSSGARKSWPPVLTLQDVRVESEGGQRDHYHEVVEFIIVYKI